MSTQQFQNTFRVALWEAYDKKCFWLREPIDYNGFHIDHVIPEKLADTPKLTKILADAGLPATFDIFGHENLVPACPVCNGRKTAMELEPHQLAFALRLVKNTLPKLVKRLKTRRKKRNLSEAIADALIADENGDWSIDEFIAVMQGKGYGKQGNTTSFVQALSPSRLATLSHARPEPLYGRKLVSINVKAVDSVRRAGISGADFLQAFMPHNLVHKLPNGTLRSLVRLKDGRSLFLNYHRSDSEIMLLSCHIANGTY
jgi:hypothetical protein